jgi:hypothetical protein
LWWLTLWRIRANPINFYQLISIDSPENIRAEYLLLLPQWIASGGVLMTS